MDDKQRNEINERLDGVTGGYAFLDWHFPNNDVVRLDGEFTLDELKEIVAILEEHKGA